MLVVNAKAVKVNNPGNQWMDTDRPIVFNLVWHMDQGLEIDFPHDRSHELDKDQFAHIYRYRFTLTKRYKNGQMIFTAKLSANVKRDIGQYGHEAVMERLTKLVMQNMR